MANHIKLKLKYYSYLPKFQTLPLSCSHASNQQLAAQNRRAYPLHTVQSYIFAKAQIYQYLHIMAEHMTSSQAQMDEMDAVYRANVAKLHKDLSEKCTRLSSSSLQVLESLVDSKLVFPKVTNNLCSDKPDYFQSTYPVPLPTLKDIIENHIVRACASTRIAIMTYLRSHAGIT